MKKKTKKNVYLQKLLPPTTTFRRHLYF